MTEAAENILLELLKAVDKDKLNSLLGVQSDITIGQFEEEFIKCTSSYYTKNSKRQIEYSFRQLKKYFGNCELYKIVPKNAEGFISGIASPSARSLIYRTLKSVFNKAVIWNYITLNPFTKFKLQKVQKSRPVYLSPEQLSLVCEKEDRTHLKDIYWVLFFTGLRAGELLNLTWDFVNLGNQLLEIGSSTFTTKSKKIRIVPLSEPALNILSKYIPKVTSLNKSFIFNKGNGFPFSVGYVSKRFKRACRAAGMPGNIHLHSLRHSAASYLVQSGVPLYTVKNILGHSSIEVTQIYSHLDIGSLRNAMSTFNKIKISS